VQRRHTVVDDLFGQVGVCAILQMRDNRPHGISTGLQFAGERRIVAVWLELHMRSGLRSGAKEEVLGRRERVEEAVLFHPAHMS